MKLLLSLLLAAILAMAIFLPVTGMPGPPLTQSPPPVSPTLPITILPTFTPSNTPTVTPTIQLIRATFTPTPTPACAYAGQREPGPECDPTRIPVIRIAPARPMTYTTAP